MGLGITFTTKTMGGNCTIVEPTLFYLFKYITSYNTHIKFESMSYIHPRLGL